MYCKSLLGFLAVLVAICTVGCGGSKPAYKNTRASEVESIIAKAQNMTFDELAKKAIEESNGKDFFGLGNTSRGKMLSRSL